MTALINALKNIEGRQTHIYTEHKLFGSQNIYMRFRPETEIGIGFRCKDQVIYIDEDDIAGYSIKGNEIVIKGSLMCINITVVD